MSRSALAKAVHFGFMYGTNPKNFVIDPGPKLEVGDHVEHIETGEFGVVAEPLTFNEHMDALFKIFNDTMGDVWVRWDVEYMQKPVRAAKLRKLSLLEVLAREAREPE